MAKKCEIKVFIGFITYNDATAKYLPYFLPSLTNQTFKDFKIIAVDNSESRENNNAEYLKNNAPAVEFIWAGENLGFAKAFNLMINSAVKDKADYFLALNPDMVCEPEMFARLVEIISMDDKIGAVMPKILKWDFTNRIKTNVIDSYGIICDKKLRFRDDQQGQIDVGAGDIVKDIFGFTGAAVMFNLKALEDIAYIKEEEFSGGQALKNKEFFDESMFMYKEDCDLSVRLRLAGWKIKLAGSAVTYHDRTASRIGDSLWRIIKNRTGKKRKIKIWSFQGQWVMVLKYGRLPFSLKTKFYIWWYQFEILVFTILFEQYLLKELVGIYKIRKQISDRRQQLKIRVDLGEIEKLFS